MRIDFTADMQRVAEHLRPVYEALPARMRGAFGRFDGLKLDRNRAPLVVGNPQAAKKARRLHRPVIVMAHDMGETFGSEANSSPSYLRQPDNWKINLFLPPGPHLSEKQRQAFPHVPSIPVGCPKMDVWHNQTIIAPENDKPVVAVAFTWFWQTQDALPKGAFPYYKDAIKRLIEDGRFHVVGRPHPKVERRIRRQLSLATVSYEWTMRNADVLVSDYGSMLFEFASIDRPVVLLNAPWFKGLPNDSIRFWKCVTVGVNCWHPDDLVDAIETALVDSEEQQNLRRKAIEYVYPYRGDSAKRAAKEIQKFTGNVEEELVVAQGYIECKALKTFTGAGVSAKKGEKVSLPTRWLDAYVAKGLVEPLPKHHTVEVPEQTTEAPVQTVEQAPWTTEEPIETKQLTVDDLKRRGPYYVMPDGHTTILGKKNAEDALAEYYAAQHQPVGE